MILRMLHAGSRRPGALDSAADDYQIRLSRYLRVDERLVKPAKLPKGEASDKAVQRALADEAERLLAALGPRDYVVALDKGGKTHTSEALAEKLAAWKHEGWASVTFVLGSAHGLDPSVTKAANERWSFGPMTLPHDLARVVLWEQLYRAESILRGLPYHK